MNHIPQTIFVSFLAISGILQANDPPTTPPGSASAKVIRYGEKDVVTVKAKIRFTTLIVLPKQEQILDFTCGDKDFWIVNGNQNFAYVKPAKEGSQTDLNLITASGNVYSFLLTEVSRQPDSEADLKIFIEPKDDSMLSAASGQPRFVAAQQIEDYRQQVEIAKTEARDAKQAAQTTIERETSQFRTQYPSSLKFPYRFDAGKKPFNLTAMYHDGKFTYIQAHPDEPPALYELKDGKPDLIQFEFRDGIYVTAKVLDSGYFAIGKQKLPFIRQDVSEKTGAADK
jgi:type IV secretory pathway VirB9-like protein